MEMIILKKLVSIVLALVMIFALTATFAAADSPTPKDLYTIVVDYDPADGSLGTADGDKKTVSVEAVGEDGEVKLTAIQKGNGEFVGWTIDGKYEVISGTMTDPVIVIKPLSDIQAHAKFVQPGATPDSPSKPANPDEGKSSPKTGDPLWIVLGLSILALGLGAVAVKKIKA